MKFNLLSSKYCVNIYMLVVTYLLWLRRGTRNRKPWRRCDFPQHNICTRFINRLPNIIGWPILRPFDSYLKSAYSLSKCRGLTSFAQISVFERKPESGLQQNLQKGKRLVLLWKRFWQFLCFGLRWPIRLLHNFLLIKKFSTKVLPRSNNDKPSTS